MTSSQPSGSFTGQQQTHTFAGFLFDLDGTIIDTTEAVTRHWEKSVELFLLATTSLRRGHDIESVLNWEWITKSFFAVHGAAAPSIRWGCMMSPRRIGNVCQSIHFLSIYYGCTTPTKNRPLLLDTMMRMIKTNIDVIN